MVGKKTTSAGKDAGSSKKAAPSGDKRSGQIRRGNVVLGESARKVAARFNRNGISPTLLTGVLRAAEFTMVFLAGLIAYVMYVQVSSQYNTLYIGTSAGGALLTLIGLQIIDAYQPNVLRTYIHQLGKVFGIWTLVFAAFGLVVFFAKVGPVYSRVWLALWYVGGLVGFTVIRAITSTLVRKWTRDGRLERRAIIVGGGKDAEQLIRSLEAQTDNDIRICGIFDDRTDDRSPLMVAGYPKLGTIAELVEFGRLARIDMLIVSLPLAAENRVLEMLKKIWVLPVDIRLSAHTNKLRFRPRSYSYVGNVPFIDVVDKPIADWDSVAKRVFDFVISATALVLLSPFMLATAIAIKMESKGPIIFRQQRFGFNNEVVSVLKFRSMYTDMTDHDAKKSVTKDDPRVTKVGRFIRKTSIDELPQLVNVLRGELSLVGPRPHAVNAHTENRLWDEVVDGYFGRHRVKPGVTGWAQVNGLRGEVDNEEKIRRRVEHDLYYIENWSVLFDFYILMITPFRLMNTENAY